MNSNMGQSIYASIASTLTIIQFTVIWIKYVIGYTFILTTFLHTCQQLDTFIKPTKALA